MRAPNARDTALHVLVSCRTAGAWADAALRAQLRRDGLSGPEAALCSRIVYGVMQNRLLLDFYLGAYCSQKVDHMQPPLLEILRIGAYQILFLDKIPHSAAVNQAVEQAKANGQAKDLRRSMEQWMGRVEREYDALRTEVEATISHAADQLDKAGKCLEQVSALLSDQDVALEELSRAYDSTAPDKVPAPVPLEEEP